MSDQNIPSQERDPSGVAFPNNYAMCKFRYFQDLMHIDDDKSNNDSRQQHQKKLIYNNNKKKKEVFHP